MDKGAFDYQRYLDGDDEGLVEIIKDYKDGLELFLNRYVGDLEIAEELTEDTFVRLFTKRPHFRPNATFKTWLYVIGRNLAISYLRKRRKVLMEPFEEQDIRLQNQASNIMVLEQEYLREERRIQVHRMLLELSPEYGRVLYLKFFEELTNEEIARILKKTKRQVENQLYQAKRAMREVLEREGIDNEECF